MHLELVESAPDETASKKASRSPLMALAWWSNDVIDPDDMVDLLDDARLHRYTGGVPEAVTVRQAARSVMEKEQA
jgi:hypothetical protein